MASQSFFCLWVADASLSYSLQLQLPPFGELLCLSRQIHFILIPPSPSLGSIRPGNLPVRGKLPFSLALPHNFTSSWQSLACSLHHVQSRRGLHGYIFPSTRSQQFCSPALPTATAYPAHTSTCSCFAKRNGGYLLSS